jgi:hypothetical protein
LFFGLSSFTLCEWVNDHIIVGFLELDSGIPLLIGRYLLRSFFDEPSVEPKVEGKLLHVEFYADDSWGRGPKLLDYLLLLILIRYSDLYIIINKLCGKREAKDSGSEYLQRVEQLIGQMISQ